MLQLVRGTSSTGRSVETLNETLALESLFEELILEVTAHSRFKTTQSSRKAVFIFRQV